MRLREALSLCTDEHLDDWVRVPGARPATSMLGGLFDPGAAEPQLRPLVGDRVIVYEPDPRLAIVWMVPEDDDETRHGERRLPEWAENDSADWNHARFGWAVIVLSGAPIWQAPVWYLDWGSGIGGYVPFFRPVFSDGKLGEDRLKRWEASTWDVGFARLLDSFEGAGGLGPHDPTGRICPKPSPVHPVDEAMDNR
jgi:hypothetical protein